MAAKPIIDVCGIFKSFGGQSPVLRDITFTAFPGEIIALIGASGSGKSTLIRCIAGLTTIDRSGSGDESSGSISLFGLPMQTSGRITARAGTLRARTGVIFQQFNLVPRLSVLTNVCMGHLGKISRARGTLGLFTREEKREAMRALERVAIAEHALKRGSELSGGQQQRAAIARTLVQRAELVLADEPIASLDPSSARRVMKVLTELNRDHNITILVSLHQVEYAIKYCPRTIALRQGKVVFDGPTPALTREFLTELYGDGSQELFLPGFDKANGGREEAPVHNAGDWGFARKPFYEAATFEQTAGPIEHLKDPLLNQ